MNDLHLFDACSPRELRTVARNSTQIVRRSGSLLAREGSRKVEFFVIVSGSALVTRDDLPRTFMTQGDWFGEADLLARSPYSYGLLALTDVELVVMSSAEFATVFESVPSFRRRVVTRLAARASHA